MESCYGPVLQLLISTKWFKAILCPRLDKISIWALHNTINWKGCNWDGKPRGTPRGMSIEAIGNTWTWPSCKPILGCLFWQGFQVKWWSNSKPLECWHLKGNVSSHPVSTEIPCFSHVIHFDARKTRHGRLSVNLLHNTCFFLRLWIKTLYLDNIKH